MPDEKMKQIGRLAMRHEGNFWNAYYALPETMNKALPLGSIAMKAIADHPERKRAFMDLMREFVADIIEEQCGGRPIMPGPSPAPEHERAGHS